MRIFKNILDFYIESSLHVAVAVYALIRVTFFKLNMHYDESVAYFGFFGTIVGYNFIKYDALVRVKRIPLTKRFKAIIGLSFVCFWFMLYYFWKLERITKWLSVFALLLTVLYTIPIIPKKSNIRNWTGVKIYLVALSWVIVTVLLPVINSNYAINLLVIFKSVQRFILVFVLMLLFEIIDLKEDAKYLQTIPQKIGIKKTKILNYIGIFLFLLLEYLQPSVTFNQLNIAFFLVLILIIFTFYAKLNRNKYYTSFWVESIPIIWLLLLLSCY